jgi:hypothetical protein
MNAWVVLRRALGVLALVAGVFAMHGLTADHEVAMASMHSPASAVMPAEHAPAPAHVMEHRVVLPIALIDAFDRVEIAAAGEPHGMVGTCLAVLTGLLLLLALVLGLRNLLAWRPVVPLMPAQRLMLSDRAPPWLAPSLSKLCVLRT